MQPQIIIDPYDAGGYHNKDIQNSLDRLHKVGIYQDVSTICIIPTRGVIPARVVQNWMSMMVPMNQKFNRQFMIGMEVGHAYSYALENILNTPQLADWKYLLTIEEDNLVPQDGLLKLIEAIDGQVDGKKYDAVGGLYWTKGPAGQPMCYGNPNEMPRGFNPQIPFPNSITPCNGLGMGFTLFRIEMFKDPRLARPLFETVQKFDRMTGSGTAFTQDLNFFHKAVELGYKFACDSRVLVGHYDIENDIVW